uniref:Uncharacterized protein n=1 Tax=Spumella elongata TaxID=89044 RepID=A0A7S3HFL6_9STRA|mmetsp:Transcript_50316/g.87811  ORF Transcript_50316/g.87811 Transcript_50316/m.87811 type:complete len:133 (+) Transcript_50316:14-412(+)
MSTVPQIENYKEYLAPLLETFQKESFRGFETDNEGGGFSDEFGNRIGLSIHSQRWFVKPVIDLLKTNQSGYVEIQNLDKGHMSYRLNKYSDSFYLLSQLKVNTWIIGKFDQFVVLRSLDPLIQLLEQCEDEV